MQPPAAPTWGPQPTPASADRRLILVGASVRAAAESARRAGYSPLAVDFYGDRQTRSAAAAWYPLQRVLDAEDLARSGSTADAIADASVPVAIAGGLRGRVAEPLGRWIGGSRPRLGILPAADLEFDSPRFLSCLARESGVRFPQWRETPPPEARAGAWLVKERRSCGGLGVSWHRAADRSPGAAGAWPPDDCVGGGDGRGRPTRYWQRYHRGRTVGATFLSDGREAMLIGTCRQLCCRFGDRPFVFCGAWGPCRAAASVRQRITAVAAAFVARMPMVGPLNIDFLIHRDDVLLLEVNPRWSGSMELHERSWQRCLGHPCSLYEPLETWRRRMATGTPGETFIKRVVFARREQRIDPARHFPAALPPERSDWEWTDVPYAAATVPAGTPIATLVGPWSAGNQSAGNQSAGNQSAGNRSAGWEFRRRIRDVSA